jgi:hypothetical protein
MTTVRVIDETGIAAADINTLVIALKYFTPLVTKAWSLPDVSFVVGGAPAAGDWIIYLTERKRVTGATGFHTFENGVPVAYCSPRAAYRLFGHYSKPLVVKGKQLRAAQYTEGLITTICHELAEMLCDPKISTVSAVDKNGHTWLVEVCDHVFGNYADYVVGTTDCVLPDVTTPAFYNLKGVAPFSILNAATAPFTMTFKGYGYYRTPTGQLVKI